MYKCPRRYCLCTLLGMFGLTLEYCISETTRKGSVQMFLLTFNFDALKYIWYFINLTK